MSTNFWNGNLAQFLLNKIRLKDGISIEDLSADPTLTAVDANIDSIGFFGGRTYQKQDNGNSTNWMLLADDAEVQDAILRITRLESTGVLNPPALSAGAVGTFNVGTGKIQVVDNTTDVDNPTMVEVEITAKNNVTITNLATQPVTYIMATSADTILQLSAFPTPEQRRDNAFLGVVVHTDNTTVNAINNIPDYTIAPVAQLYDLMRGIGAFNLDGNRIEENGANLSINKLSGSMFKAGVSATTNPKAPNEIDLPSQILATFRYRLQDGTEGADRTVLDPTVYDNGGVSTTVPTNNNATIQRVYVFPSNAIRLQYGQEVFSNIADAVSAVGKETFVTEDNIKENGLLLASIVIRKGATNLEDPADGQIFLASRFGELGSVGSKFSTIFQDIYENSPIPQIVFDAIRGGLRFYDNATPISGNLLEVADNAGGTIYWSVSSDTNTANALEFTESTTARLEGTAQDNIQITDSEYDDVFRAEKRFVEIEDWKENLPTGGGIILESGSGSVSQDISTPLSGHRSALLFTSNNAVFSLPSKDMTSHYAGYKNTEILFDVFFNAATYPNVFSYAVQTSPDNATWSTLYTKPIQSNGTVRALIREADQDLYYRIRIISVYSGLDISIEIDNYMVDMYPAISNPIDSTVTDVSYGAQVGEVVLIQNSVSSNINITLPTDAVEGDRVIVKDVGADLITYTVNIIGTIDGFTNKRLDSSYEALTLHSLGSGFWIIV